MQFLFLIARLPTLRPAGMGSPSLAHGFRREGLSFTIQVTGFRAFCTSDSSDFGEVDLCASEIVQFHQTGWVVAFAYHRIALARWQPKRFSRPPKTRQGVV